MPIMIVRSEHHYMVAIVTMQYIADMVHYILHAINDVISVTSTYTFSQLESTRTCFPSVWKVALCSALSVLSYGQTE